MTDREADSSRRTRAAKAAVLGATLALTLAACGSASSTSRKNAAAAASSGSSGITQGAGRGGRTVTGSPVVIPMITGLSGTFAETGHEEETSVQLLTKVVNASGGIAGHPVQFKVYNDQSQASVAVPLAARLIA
ncbi:MAG: ABC transporter substrate-binding protein, partial [Actinomycetota bacterium]|nr:ABC transporter substrate-binding protein [Actinomycetota bacterium]